MTTYHVNVQTGDDLNDGSLANPWKNDPTWATATENAASVVLADDDIIEHHSDGSEIFLVNEVGTTKGFRLADHNVNNVTIKTASGNPSAVNYNFLYTHGSTTDWEETTPGSNIWEYKTGGVSNLPSTQTDVKRLFIGGVAAAMSASQEAIDAISPFYSENNLLVLYSVGNPYTTYGPGQNNLAWQEDSEWHSGAIYLRGQEQDAGIVTQVDHTFQDFILTGMRQTVLVFGSHSYLEFNNIVGKKMTDHGMRFYCDRFYPQKYNNFIDCSVDWVTTKDEFPLWQGERGGDGFDFFGPSLGHVGDGLHVQDNGHTAFQMHPQTYNVTTPNAQFGVVACEYRDSTCDNRNSVYGRAIGCAGSESMYPLRYSVYKNITATNMQVRSQIGGYRNKYYNLNISGNSGTRTHVGETSWEFRDRGEGISAQAWGNGTLGTSNNEIIECELFNSVFVGNNLTGIKFINTTGTAAKMSGNKIYNNICVDNNLIADPTGGDQYLQIIDDADTALTPNIYHDNSVGLTGGETDDMIYYGNQLRTVTEWNSDLNALPQTPTANNVNDITRIARDGRPATGNTIQSYGILPDLAPSNYITGTDFTDFTNWAIFSGTSYRDGLEWSGTSGSMTLVTSMIPESTDWSISAVCYQDDNVSRPTTSFRIGIWNDTDGNVWNYYHTYEMEDTAPASPLCEFRSTSGTSGTGYGSWQAKFINSADAGETPFPLKIAFPRLAEETTPAYPLDYRYDRVDIDGVTATAAYIGAYFTDTENPYCPNVVQDIQYQGTEEFPTSQATHTWYPDPPRYTEATAEAKLLLYFYTKGAVTYEYSSTVAAGEVISQGIVEGTQNAVNTPVDLVVSLGATPSAYTEITSGTTQLVVSNLYDEIVLRWITPTQTEPVGDYLYDVRLQSSSLKQFIAVPPDAIAYSIARGPDATADPNWIIAESTVAAPILRGDTVPADVTTFTSVSQAVTAAQGSVTPATDAGRYRDAWYTKNSHTTLAPNAWTLSNSATMDAAPVVVDGVTCNKITSFGTSDGSNVRAGSSGLITNSDRAIASFRVRAVEAADVGKLVQMEFYRDTGSGTFSRIRIPLTMSWQTIGIDHTFASDDTGFFHNFRWYSGSGFADQCYFAEPMIEIVTGFSEPIIPSRYQGDNLDHWSDLHPTGQLIDNPGGGYWTEVAGSGATSNALGLIFWCPVQRKLGVKDHQGVPQLKGSPNIGARA